MTKEELGIKKQLEECQRLRDEYLAGWQRARADFLNYKNEEAERVSEMMKFANQELILKILEILDNIDIAEREVSRELKADLWVQGILKIKTQILDFLKKEGVEEIKCVGKNFDPNFHEIVEETKKPGFEPGVILEEIKKGYFFHGKVIRPTKVKVSK